MRSREEAWRQELETAPSFAVALGRRLREARESLGDTTERAASRATKLGLSWHRTTVGQIENGKRAVSAVELLLLPMIYAKPLRDLLPEDTTWLTDEVAVHSDELWRLAITGETWEEAGAGLFHRPGRWHMAYRETPEYRDTVVAFVEALLDRPDPWPKGSIAKYVAPPDEAETKAAKRLNTTPHFVAYAARRTWGHGLAEERDARVEQRGKSLTDRRALQAARGHATRALLRELEPVVRRLETRGEADHGEG